MTTEKDVHDWSVNNIRSVYAATPDEVKSTYRLLGVLRYLNLIKRPTFLSATSRFRVARLVIDHILVKPLI